MRVLHLIKGLGPGGAERLLVSLSEARSDDVTMEVAYLLPGKQHLAPELERLGVRTHLLAGAAGSADPRWPLRLARLVRANRPDIVHLHSPMPAAVARLVLRIGPGRPVVVSTDHNVWPSFNPLTRAAVRATAWLDAARFAVSDEVAASEPPRLRAHVEVVVQGIPVGALRARRSERPEARRALGVTVDDVVVVTVANFREKKDYPTLLRAAAHCREVSPLRFFSIGQGPLEAHLHRLCRDLDLDRAFRFLGYHPDPPAVVAGADIFVLSSLHEGLPIALLEAMALGVAPVATAVGGVPEVLTDGVDGVLVPPGDPQALADAIRAVAADPVRRDRLAERAALRAADFDIAVTQLALEARYRSLLEITP